MRLRELGLKVGGLSVGPRNSIADVAGVSVGHAAIEGEGLCCGLTAVLPYPLEVKERRLYLGHWAADGGGPLTGQQVMEDFGIFSSPIVLAPPAAMGRIYEGLLGYGLGRDAGLDLDTGWPPLVLGVEDLNPPARVHRSVAEPQLRSALQTAQGDQVQEGSVGIGRGLRAFGLKGGVGTSSRRSGEYLVGALVAAGGGSRLWADGYPLDLWARLPRQAEPGTAAAVVATDAPLLPHQLDRLAGRAALGLARAGLLDSASRQGVVLAFSTAGPVGEGVTMQAAALDEEGLPPLFGAAAEACEEAVLNALLAAAPAQVGGRALATLKPEPWAARLRRTQEERAW
ncbi:MAG: P1 family peptidase [Candidatus Latescibacteria bacterium]|nr:P1 family peptidase [Candidatus Latescibacterota bacterium]